MKIYTAQFGSGDPRGFTGLAPTFLTFYNLATGTTNTPPSIAETITGKTGIYTFSYGTTQPISFLLDAATTSPGSSGRYVAGQLDPSDRADEYGNTLSAYGLSMLALGTTGVALGTTAVALGTTAVALGNTAVAQGISGAVFGLIGNTSSSIGSTAIDPTTVFGFLMRSQQFSEGNQTYVKTSGVLDVYTKGYSTLLVEKTITDTSTQTTKS